MKHFKLMLSAGGLTLASCGEPCPDNPFTEDIACDAEPCSGAETGDEAETGGPDGAVCTPYLKPEYDYEWMVCGVDYSKGEHCLQSVSDSLGITDYAFETASASFAVKFDFLAIQDVYDPGDPDATWWTWSANYMTALPGVITHEDNGKTYAGYVSRGCCAQRVVDGVLDAPPHNPECGSGYALQDTPDAWCLPMLDGTQAGLCVFPCAVDNDCPHPGGEFCDLTRPDPYDLGPGTCRYKSMPIIPTPESDIGT